MKKNKIFFKLVLIILAICIPVQVRGVSSSQKDLELNRREAAYAEQVESHLKQTLSEYYSNDSYIINVKAHLERIAEKITSPQPIQKSNDFEMTLPGLPVSPSEREKIEPRQYYNEQWLFTDRFKVKYLEVTVLVNKDIFGSADIIFIKRVVNMNPGIESIRGDNVKVFPLAFPVKKKIADAVKEAEEKAKSKSWYSNIPVYVLVGGCVLLAFLVTILILQLLGMKKAKEHGGDSGFINHPALKGDGDVRMLEQQVKPELPSSGNGSFVSESQQDNIKELFYELRQLMVTTLIGNPELSSKIFKRWTDTNNDEDIYKLAAFLKATDPKLTEFLSEYLGKELTAKVEFAMNQIQTIEKDSLTEVFKKFREEFQNEQSTMMINGKGSGDEGDIFHFLRQLNPHQIFQLVKEESIGIVAVVLAQVPPNVATEVINNLPQEYQAKIPVEIAKLKRIPISAYRDIAKKLSKKAMELEKIRFVATDGINALVEMLEQSSPELEEQLLASVAEHDIALAEELRKVYVSFDELPFMPDRLMADVLRDINREDIVKALVNAKEAVLAKILNNLPPRTKIMVTDKLDTFQEDTPKDEITKARNIIAQRFRDMAKSGKIDLTKYIK